MDSTRMTENNGLSVAARETTVIRLVARVDGVPTRYDGLYVAHYDPALDAKGNVRLDAVAKKSEAKQFPDIGAAMEYYRKVCPNRPEDSPGHPNRPLTCYTVELQRAIDEGDTRG